jgi:hypothetical protein
MMLAYLWATDANIDVKLGKYDVKRPTLLVPYDTEWLHSHAYIPNILAGATGFLIGAPFALVVLATFTVQREERSALQRVNNLSALAWDKFRDSIYDFCSDERASQGLSSDAYFVEYVHNQIYDKYQHYIKLANTLIPDENRYRGNTDAEIAELQAYLKERSAVMQQMIYDGFKTIGTQYWLQIKWSIIRTNWNTLNQYVRLQRLERNLLWFKDELDAEFMNRLSDQHHPLTDFMTLHGLDQSKSTASMEAALAVVRRDVALPLEELAKKMLAGYTGGGSQLMHPQYYYEFGRYKVQGHREAAQKASQFLFDLRRVVNDVEREGWPKRFNRPVVSNYRPWMPN